MSETLTGEDEMKCCMYTSTGEATSCREDIDFWLTLLSFSVDLNSSDRRFSSGL